MVEGVQLVVVSLPLVCAVVVPGSGRCAGGVVIKRGGSTSSLPLVTVAATSAADAESGRGHSAELAIVELALVPIIPAAPPVEGTAAPTCARRWFAAKPSKKRSSAATRSSVVIPEVALRPDRGEIHSLTEAGEGRRVSPARRARASTTTAGR